MREGLAVSCSRLAMLPFILHDRVPWHPKKGSQAAISCMRELAMWEERYIHLCSPAHPVGDRAYKIVGEGGEA